MKKIINEPGDFVNEMLEGILKAHPDKLTSVDDDIRCIAYAGNKQKDKVSIITGGGSGHLPVFLGYVGENMLDGVAVGDVFASPSAFQILSITKYVSTGQGVLYLYGNYGGDIMNFDMAAEFAESEGIRIEQVIVNDDVASAEKGMESKRRGVAGLFYAYKIAAAKAYQGASLLEVKETAQKAVSNIRTMGIALSPCIVPEAGKPTFNINENEMEIGMGIHGEPGIRRGELRKADEITKEIMSCLLDDMVLNNGDEVSVMINGLGSTPLEELYIVFRKVHSILTDAGIKIYRPYIGEFATSLEMAGMSVTLCKLDEEIKELLDYPADTPFFVQK